MEAPITEPGPAKDWHTDRFWRRWLVTLVVSALGPVAVLYAAVILIDPFSTGRFTPIKRIDLATNNYSYGHVVRIRDLSFDAAIVGNSHGMAFDPTRLNKLTGRTFAHLSRTGGLPGEQAILAEAFARQRRGLAPVIMVILDELWCGHLESHAKPSDSFPTFLFGGSDRAYLSNVFTEHAIRTAARRLLRLAGLAEDRRRRDGLDPDAVNAMRTASPRQLAALNSLERPSTAPLDLPMPSLALWPGLLAELDRETRLVLYFSPLPLGKVPQPGSPAEQQLEACKAYFRAIVAARPHTIMIDRWVDDAFSRDIGNFSDPGHFRSGLAPALEQEIADALNTALRKP
jgi:hypothetical protein